MKNRNLGLLFFLGVFCWFVLAIFIFFVSLGLLVSGWNYWLFDVFVFGSDELREALNLAWVLGSILTVGVWLGGLIRKKEIRDDLK